MNRHNFHSLILNWYDTHRRKLPWRFNPGEEPNPYFVWLSEMMLQQTQVDTVMPYFLNFTTRWPTVHLLAEADLDDVMHLWQGLGYYARARNLHKCAHIVSKQLNGEFPKSVHQLQQLPGIGPYASAAIASIAYNISATVVDGNVARIVSRVFGFETPIKTNKNAIWKSAELLTPKDRAGDYAQALMDIGSAICMPRAPKCDQCPVSALCDAHASGNPEAYPQKAPKVTIPTRFAVAFICTKNRQILMRKRTDEKMLNNLWELPGSNWYADSLPELPELEMPYQDVKHTFSHFHLITRVFQTQVLDAEYVNEREVWVESDSLHELALSTLTKKLLSPFNLKG